MNKNVIPVAIAASVLALAACAADVEHGTITSKQYVPSDYYTVMQPVYRNVCKTVTQRVRQSNGTYTTRTAQSCVSVRSGYRAVIEGHGDCYELDLKNSSGDTGSVCVSESAWNGAKVGGQW